MVDGSVAPSASIQRRMARRSLCCRQASRCAVRWTSHRRVLPGPVSPPQRQHRPAARVTAACRPARPVSRQRAHWRPPGSGASFPHRVHRPAARCDLTCRRRLARHTSHVWRSSAAARRRQEVHHLIDCSHRRNCRASSWHASHVRPAAVRRPQRLQPPMIENVSPTSSSTGRRPSHSRRFRFWCTSSSTYHGAGMKTGASGYGMGAGLTGAARSSSCRCRAWSSCLPFCDSCRCGSAPAGCPGGSSGGSGPAERAVRQLLPARAGGSSHREAAGAKRRTPPGVDLCRRQPRATQGRTFRGDSGGGLGAELRTW